MTLIDSHAHLDMLKDPRAALERAHQAGVNQVVTIGIDLLSSQKAGGFASQEENVFCTVGLHPHDASQIQDNLWPQMKVLTRQTNAVAIGECGLDYFRNRSPREAQREAFSRQIELAREVGLPLVVHDRDAHQEVLDLLREQDAGEIGGVVHCFSGDAAVAKEFLNLGFYLGITGAITYPKSETLQEAARFAPLERLLVETDCPFLTPVPNRGKPNEPAYVAYTAKALARILDLDPDKASQAFSDNTRRLFGLPAPGE